MTIAYSVIATLPDRATADEYVTWLRDGHIQQVIAGGALRGDIVRITDPATPAQIESRYVFANRQAFDRYTQTTAPALRADGLRRFPPERGVTFQRRLGEVVDS